MKLRLMVGFYLLAISSGSVVSQDQTPAVDLSGNWTLSMTAILPNQASCDFEGSAQVIQNNGTLAGEALQNRVSGSPNSCPASMAASLMGTLSGNKLQGSLDGGDQFGTAAFSGDVGSDGMSLTGTFATESLANGTTQTSPAATTAASPTGPAPFAGITGNWQAQVGAAAMEIPVLSGLGMAALVALVLLSSLVVLRRSAA